MCVVPFSDTMPYFVSPEETLLGMASEGGSASQGLGAQGGLAVDGQWGLQPQGAGESPSKLQPGLNGLVGDWELCSLGGLILLIFAFEFRFN